MSDSTVQEYITFEVVVNIEHVGSAYQYGDRVPVVHRERFITCIVTGIELVELPHKFKITLRSERPELR